MTDETMMKLERFRLIERQPGARMVFLNPCMNRLHERDYQQWCSKNCAGAWSFERDLGAAVFLNETDETLFRTNFGGTVQS